MFRPLKKVRIALLSASLIGASVAAFGQGAVVKQGDEKSTLLGQRNVVTTSVPFLLITPDSRAAGMGDAGVATTPDANSVHWNPGKMAFIENDGGLSVSAAPWLKQLVPDVWFYYLSGYKKVGDRKRTTVGASMRYFSLGTIQFTDVQGEPLGNYEPKEFAFDGSYSTQLSDRFSLGIALRFIYSDLARGQTGSNGAEIKAGIAGAGDVGAYWNDEVKIGERDFDYSIGAAITNIGNKITYTTEANRDFIPVNLRVGTYWKTDIDEYNSIGLAVDFNKLLVPTPQPEYLKSEVNPNQDSVDSDGNKVIVGKVVDDGPVISGMLQSFGDAPGGFREELREFTTSIGVEYWYAKQFAVRAGYFYEAETKGARQYLTFGLGLRYNVFGIDAAYLQPFARRHPLQNTVRFSLLFDLDAFKSQDSGSKS